MKIKSVLNTISLPIFIGIALVAGVGYIVSTTPDSVSSNSFVAVNAQLAAANANTIPTSGGTSAEFKTLTDFSGSPQLSSLADGVDLPSFLQGLFDLAIVAGATLAVIQITRGGFLYMTKDVISSKIQAKELIRDAVFGLVLLLSTVLILRQINPNLVNLELNPTPPPAPQVNAGSAGSSTAMTTEQKRSIYQSQGLNYLYTAGSTDFCMNSSGTHVPCQSLAH